MHLWTYRIVPVHGPQWTESTYPFGDLITAIGPCFDGSEHARPGQRWPRAARLGCLVVEVIGAGRNGALVVGKVRCGRSWACNEEERRQKMELVNEVTRARKIRENGGERCGRKRGDSQHFYNPRRPEGTRWQGALSMADAMEIHLKRFIGFRERR
jgi:hypothetical protein